MIRDPSRAVMYRTIEDSDEYEEDGYDQDEEDAEEEEEEEDPKPTKEELEYLELRERLKEAKRKQMKKESAASTSTSQSQVIRRKLPYDNYGSFFGPSKPVIAQRVIQESKSILENQHLTSKLSHSHNVNKKTPTATTAERIPVVDQQRPKIIKELKRKVEKLKDTRDYSFLLSDDAEFPAHNKEPPTRNIPVRKSDVRAAETSLKSKQPISKLSRPNSSGREERKPISTNLQTQSKGGLHKAASKFMPKSTSADPRKQLGGNTGNGPGRPAGPMTPSKFMSKSTSADPRKQLGGNTGNGPGRPAGPKGLPSKMPAHSLEKKASSLGVKNTMAVGQKTSVSKLPSAAQKQHLDPRREFRAPDKAKVIPKQPVSSSKPQMNPSRKISSHANIQEYRPKKKPARPFSDEDDDEGEQAISMIRKMFGYNPKKYAGDDDDDSDMEANFDDILMEEKRSERIAKQEDERELRLIEEEERRERMRKEAKKRKLSQR